MSTFVIGDIHGELEQLKTLIQKINLNDEDELYVLGDVIDRGPSSIEALQYLMTMSNCTCIAGNHELMMLSNMKLLLGEISDNFLMNLSPEDFTTVHNYIDHDSNIIRKGAVSAKKGEKLLIPINMRDGSLLCVGKGNEDWNCSAPHGAGRLFSRSAAKYEFTVEEYAKTMEEAGIYSTCIDWSTLDECPMAYKGMEDIINNIGPTADIMRILKPVYNFKATSPNNRGEDKEKDVFV